MAAKDIYTRIKNKHDLEVNWDQATGFIPWQGELIIYDVEVDTDGNILTKTVNGVEVSLLPEGRDVPYTYERLKIGDGITPVKDLPFISDQEFNSRISCGTTDPDVDTVGKFYFKYSN